MKKLILIIFVALFSYINIANAQTLRKDVNKDLDALRNCIFNENYEQLAKFTHPEIIKMMGGKAKMIEVTKSEMDKIKRQGITYESLGFKDPSSFIKNDQEIQFSITQEIVMDTPRGKVLTTSSMIGISYDNGANWTFIDTMGKNKETIRQLFPFVSDNIVLKPRSSRVVEEENDLF